MDAPTRWLTDTEQRAWRAYLHMQADLGAALNRQLLADSDLSSADFAVLVELTDQSDGRVRVLELARSLRWEKSRLSHQLGRMKRRGLVARDACGEDRRGSFVVITEAGRAAIAGAAPSHVRTVRRLVFDGLTPAQVDVLATISESVLARLAGEPFTGCNPE